MGLIHAILFFFAAFSSCFAVPLIEEMTLEEKVGQLLMAHFRGETSNEEATRLLQNAHVGGIIYYKWANGLHSPEQVSHLSAGLQATNLLNRLPIPLFIAVDQEGGRVTRLTEGFTRFPDNKVLGMTGRAELAEARAFATGQELRAVGVNFNLAPVVDVNSNPKNPVIGPRAFGDRTEVVIPFARRALAGYRNAGVISSLKHFPGHGDVEVDSHEGLPLVKKSKEELQKVELLPFLMLAKEADTIMTAHLIASSVDPIFCATLSKKVLDVLRNEIGFQGVIISDSLVMQGVLKNSSSIESAAIQAINAGCDLLLLGGKQLASSTNDLELSAADVERIHEALVHAVQKGLIPIERIDQSVQRILNLKDRYSLFAKEEWFPLVNGESHRAIVEQIGASISRKEP